MAATSDSAQTAGGAPPQDLLRYIAEGTAGTYGETFFRRLVEHVAKAFDSEVAFVAELLPDDPSRARFLACWENGALVDPADYSLDGTPCALVDDHDVVLFERGVVERFPTDEMVTELGLDSYFAIALRGADGTHLGHLGVLATRALDPDEAKISALRIFAARASAEVERRRHERELAASRARIVQAGDDARRRIERNLHDGAQQRLVALALQLRVAESQLRHDPEAVRLLAAASDELQSALRELRELARGIHPAVLSDHGLATALDALAARTPLPVTLELCPRTQAVRMQETVEATVYYLVAEALTNVTRYAAATSATVRVEQVDATLHVTVRDDGGGGASLGGGSGLRGLADRVEALRGTLAVESPAGGGTVVRAAIPLA